MKFEEDIVDRVRSSADIVDVIGGYVRLQKAGQNFRALCPFHQEKTPSFMVSEAKQLFKCFGCGVGGDVFRFVMEIERLSFPEAIRHLADRYGITLPNTAKTFSQEEDKRGRLLSVMSAADLFFRQQFGALEPQSQPVSYLSGRRISQETIEQFGLGYSPGTGLLVRLLRQQGYSLAEIEACGLVRPGQDDRQIERFRNRIIFPIFDVLGRTIAFGGRLLGEGQPKYLNSPETPLYIKGTHLYGLSLARDEIRRRDFAILVEGYFDCIVPYQFGIHNVVASLGTALTEQQVKLLGRYTRKVIVSFDPDSAGVTAAMRSIDLFLQSGFQTNVLQLPRGEDPDSYIIRQGVEAYLECVRRSSRYFDFLLNHFLAGQKDPNSPRAKQEVAASILPYVAKVPNRIERAEYLAQVADRLRIDPQLLFQELRKFTGIRTPGSQGTLTRVQPLQATPAERTLLTALFDEHFSAGVLNELEADLVEGLQSAPIFQKVIDCRNQNSKISVITLRDQLSAAEVELLDSSILSTSDVPLSPELVRSSLAALEDLQIERISRQIQQEIALAEKSGAHSPQINSLLRRKEELRRRKLSR